MLVLNAQKWKMRAVVSAVLKEKQVRRIYYCPKLRKLTTSPHVMYVLKKVAISLFGYVFSHKSVDLRDRKLDTEMYVF